jgi:hypothetical protein
VKEDERKERGEGKKERRGNQVAQTLAIIIQVVVQIPDSKSGRHPVKETP